MKFRSFITYQQRNAVEAGLEGYAEASSICSLDVIEIKSRQEKVILSCCLSSQVVTGRDATSLAAPLDGVIVDVTLPAIDRSRALD